MPPLMLQCSVRTGRPANGVGTVILRAIEACYYWVGLFRINAFGFQLPLCAGQLDHSLKHQLINTHSPSTIDHRLFIDKKQGDYLNGGWIN